MYFNLDYKHHGSVPTGVGSGSNEGYVKLRYLEGCMELELGGWMCLRRHGLCFGTSTPTGHIVALTTFLIYRSVDYCSAA